MSETPSTRDVLTQLNLKPVNSPLLVDYPPVICIENGESMLHEESHVMRVLIYADLICQQLESKGVAVNRHAILSAIRIHDSYRRQEYEDEGDHGFVAISYAYFNGTFVDDPDEKLILELARWHSVDDADILSQTLWNELPIELKILKDADALDRYRDAHHDEIDANGPDPEYFRLDITHKLMPVAEALCEEYFNPRPRQEPVSSDLISIGQNLGIIERAL
jgi:hypothetical protein